MSVSRFIARSDLLLCLKIRHAVMIRLNKKNEVVRGMSEKHSFLNVLRKL